MCGIVAVLPRYDVADPGATDPITTDPVATDPEAPAGWPVGPAGAGAVLSIELPACGGAPRSLPEAAAILGRVASALSNAVAGLSHASMIGQIAADESLRLRLIAWLDQADAWVANWDGYLDTVTGADPDELEAAQRQTVLLRDLLYSLRHDRTDAARRIRELGFAAQLQGSASPDRSATAERLAVSYLAIDTALAAIDRLEVRGRDSAGIQIWVGLDESDRPAVVELAGPRDDLYRCGATELVDDGIVFTYKRAAVLGALGDNVAFMRDRIAADARLAAALRRPSARVSVLAHTRWASCGRVSEPNAHPVNSVCRTGSSEYRPGRFTTAVLNGDIDSHVEVRRNHSIATGEITTDAKLIPVLVAAASCDGHDLGGSLRMAVDQFTGSMAIGVQSDADHLAFAVKGSGQGLYIGLVPWCFFVASEVYGLVSWTDQYVRLEPPDGGAVVVTLDRERAGTPAGIENVPAAGGRTSAAEAEAVAATLKVRTAEVTTRDVARGEYEHYLVKEIAGAPASFRKSLRGRIVEQDGRLRVSAGLAGLPEDVRAGFASGRFKELVFAGQGTAAAACQGIAEVIRPYLPGVSVRAIPATELSVQDLPDLGSVCVVAVSQSGTTTDTNRAVDMVRGRGAAVLGIVNRRDSDLTHKCHGVMYTSDGRDVEMAVASTKAFYSQVATGVLLGLEMAKSAGTLDEAAEHSLLRGLLDMPERLAAVQQLGPVVAEIARQAPSYAAWAVVGSGLNRVSAAEVRIKCSELCYRTVSTDALEDKKHIDLSAEALILVCAAGTPPQQVRDMAKEIEIFAAHHNAPVVIVDEDVDVAWATKDVIRVPRAHPKFAWILSTAVGHLFAYHAARAINDLGLPLRKALTILEERVDAGASRLADIATVAEPLHEFLAEIATGRANGVLSPARALALTNTLLLLRGASAPAQVPGGFGLDGPIDHIRQQLTGAVDELTRSIDSVKHQAKTVTVGTSRGDGDLLENHLIQALVAAGSDTALLTFPVLLALRAYGPVVASVSGAVRYQVDGGRLRALAKTGMAAELVSRADAPDGAPLVGSKRYTVDTRAVHLVRGLRDGRLVLMVPEQAGSKVSGLALLHVSLAEAVTAAQLLAAVEATEDRLARLTAAVTEQDLPFDAEALAKLPVETVLIGSIDAVLAGLSSSGPSA